jgi:hypothetical protein
MLTASLMREKLERDVVERLSLVLVFMLHMCHSTENKIVVERIT